MKRQTFAVELEQPGTSDTIEYTIQTDNRDLVRWDLVRGRKGWPTSTDAPVLWATVVSYFALLRAGEIQNTESVEAFIDRAVAVQFIKPETGEPLTADEIAAGEGSTDADPFLTGAELGS